LKEIGNDFVTGLPMNKNKNEMVWVVVDMLTKNAQFIDVNQNDPCEKLIDVHVRETVSKHGAPNKIVTSAFWKQLHEALGSKLDYSTTYHP
jgi:hypothetical protein